MKAFYPSKDYGIVEFEMKMDLQKKIWPTKQEMESVNMKDLPDGTGTTWDMSKEKPLILSLNEAQVKLLKDGLKILDKNKQLNDDLMPLALKIKNL